MSDPAGDRVTIDLRGIGAAVRSAAAGRELTIAAFAREALVGALSEAPPQREMPDAPAPRLHGTVKLTWRMDVRAAEALAANARALGLSYGQYVGYLVSAAPLPTPVAQRAADRAALQASTDHLAVLAREFAKAELANHRYVMVPHTHQANPHVHLAVRAEGRDGRRLNPRKQDLRRWRAVFAERLRGLGVEAEATSKVVRGSVHRNERLWERKAYDDGRTARRAATTDAKLTPARRHVAQAWCEIAKALASSDDMADRELSRSVVNYARWLPGVRNKSPERQAQRELAGVQSGRDRSHEATHAELTRALPQRSERGFDLER